MKFDFLSGPTLKIKVDNAPTCQAPILQDKVGHTCRSHAPQ